jgi:hypothetical protein
MSRVAIMGNLSVRGSARFPSSPANREKSGQGRESFHRAGQLLADSSASVSSGTHHGNHRPPRFLTGDGPSNGNDTDVLVEPIHVRRVVRLFDFR